MGFDKDKVRSFASFVYGEDPEKSDEMFTASVVSYDGGTLRVSLDRLLRSPHTKRYSLGWIGSSTYARELAKLLERAADAYDEVAKQETAKAKKLGKVKG